MSSTLSSLVNSPSISEEIGNRQGLGVEIISVENIKPSSPTPDSLRIYETSFLDQLCQNLYMPCIYFYLNNDEHVNPQLIAKRRQLLKQSLSETLTRFYPLAGKVKDDRFIDCNDEGVYYVEAKVNAPISSILHEPDNKPVHELLPFEPTSPELPSQISKFVVMIKATLFSCGGIAIGTCTSHKLIDGRSYATFMTAWANTARGSSDNICPSFVSPMIFPPHSSVDSKGTAETFHADETHGRKVTSRFVFSAASVKTLKRKAEAPSRVMAVAGLIWKCSMAARVVKSSSALMVIVDIRERCSPPFSPFSIGNIILPAIAQCEENEFNLGQGGLPFLVSLLSTATNQVNSDNIETLKGKDGYKNGQLKYFEPLKQLACEPNNLFITVSSLCNREIYEADFGWGKPIWVRIGSSDSACAVAANATYLVETRDGGIEAFVTLSEIDIHMLERNTELLSYVSVNPNPL